MMDYFQKVKEFVDSEFEEANRPDHLTHLDRTVDWVRELEENPSQALLIAAYAHDADHAERWKNKDINQNTAVKEKDFTDRERLQMHQDRGAEIVGDFLEREDASEKLVAKVRQLISRHEFGGTREQNILKDADSLSFLENNVENFLEYADTKYRKEDVGEKFDWMYNRISSDRAREIAKPWYRDAVKRLENK